jgi:hypothetical protein
MEATDTGEVVLGRSLLFVLVFRSLSFVLNRFVW